jgi:hypothetical protein
MDVQRVGMDTGLFRAQIQHVKEFLALERVMPARFVGNAHAQKITTEQVNIAKVGSIFLSLVQIQTFFPQ